mmetsp:Transcript_24443/g.53136  ORF Transcript_24443/g.53136 Transcript_24443/m.53136 type:complete len:357 (+) Transcript_24443:1537-2607(+)
MKSRRKRRKIWRGMHVKTELLLPEQYVCIGGSGWCGRGCGNGGSSAGGDASGGAAGDASDSPDVPEKCRHGMSDIAIGIAVATGIVEMEGVVMARKGGPRRERKGSGIPVSAATSTGWALSSRAPARRGGVGGVTTVAAGVVVILGVAVAVAASTFARSSSCKLSHKLVHDRAQLFLRTERRFLLARALVGHNALQKVRSPSSTGVQQHPHHDGLRERHAPNACSKIGDLTSSCWIHIQQDPVAVTERRQQDAVRPESYVCSLLFGQQLGVDLPAPPRAARRRIEVNVVAILELIFILFIVVVVAVVVWMLIIFANQAFLAFCRCYGEDDRLGLCCCSAVPADVVVAVVRNTCLAS